MSATTAFITALIALLGTVADLVSEKGPLFRIIAGGRTWWRLRHPLPLTPTQVAAADQATTDGRIEDLREHVEILKDLAATATRAANRATEAAEAAQESAGIARRELERVTELLDRWHTWAVRWWPVLADEAERLGVPDPPSMATTQETS